VDRRWQKWVIRDVSPAHDGGTASKADMSGSPVVNTIKTAADEFACSFGALSGAPLVLPLVMIFPMIFSHL
jgi:hypothetical protein